MHMHTSSLNDPLADALASKRQSLNLGQNVNLGQSQNLTLGTYSGMGMAGTASGVMEGGAMGMGGMGVGAGAGMGGMGGMGAGAGVNMGMGDMEAVGAVVVDTSPLLAEFLRYSPCLSILPTPTHPHTLSTTTPDQTQQQYQTQHQTQSQHQSAQSNQSNPTPQSTQSLSYANTNATNANASNNGAIGANGPGGNGSGNGPYPQPTPSAPSMHTSNTSNTSIIDKMALKEEARAQICNHVIQLLTRLSTIPVWNAAIVAVLQKVLDGYSGVLNSHVPQSSQNSQNSQNSPPPVTPYVGGIPPPVLKVDSIGVVLLLGGGTSGAYTGTDCRTFYGDAPGRILSLNKTSNYATLVSYNHIYGHQQIVKVSVSGCGG
jgi:hypothetical protein